MPVELIKSLMNEDEDIKGTNNNTKRIKPLLNSKFATDKYNHSLRRDLLVSNFDKTMIVEKARFEPLEDPIVATTQSAPILTQQAHIPKTTESFLSNDENVSHRSDPVHKSESDNSPPVTYALTMSPSAPTLSANTASGNENTYVTSAPLTTTQSHNDKRRLTQVRSEGNQNISSSTTTTTTSRKKQNSKKQTKPVLHGTASPAEVFHRNLVDAVSNVEDSDENEHYVYPYSGNESSGHHDMTGIHRPLSVRSTPVTLLHDSSKKKNGSGHSGIGDWFKHALSRNSNNQSHSTPTTHFHSLDEEDEEEGWSGYEYNRRPKLRSQIKDHRTHKNSTTSLLSRWHDSFRSTTANTTSDKNSNTKKYRRTYPPMQKIGSQPQSLYYTNGGTNGHHSMGNGTGGYTSDEEDAPLLWRRQQQKRMSRSGSGKKQTCKNIFRNSILLIIFMIGVLCIIIVYKAQPLVELTVDMGRVLATDKELIFDLKVQAENYNWWTVHVADADISVFAFSQIVPSSYLTAANGADVNITTVVNSTTHTRGVDPAEYLGNLLHFDEPLSLPSSLFNYGPIEAISQIRIKSPGADASGNERWSRMIRYPYGLVVRGVLKYKPAPFDMGMYLQSAAVCSVSRVDPTTGAVSIDPDRTICAGQQQ